MTKFEAKKRIQKLSDLIRRYRYQYHVHDVSEISDDALDSLKKELFDLEAQYPDLVEPDSPTQRVGGEPLDAFEKVRHLDSEGQDARMHSLNDVFSLDDLHAWQERLSRYLNTPFTGPWYGDVKMDGLAIELVYEKGLLVQASTRGDGLIGEGVLHNVKTIDAIPLRLHGDVPGKLVVRGEVFLTKKEFARINQDQKKRGEKIYANPRNVAAGSIRQLDPKMTASRKLSFYGYGIVGQGAAYYRQYPTRADEYRALQRYGIPVNPEGKICATIDGVSEFYEHIGRIREKLPYEIDGVVITVNDNRIYEEAGIVGTAPRGAAAFKFAPSQAETIVEDIIVQVGRTGVLTPVAVLRPVPIGGVTVSRATLHNVDEIERLGVRIGDTVIVGRAGDVIPDIISVLKDLRTGKEKAFHMPKKCPSCGQAVHQVKDQVAFRCTNTDCPAIRRKSIYLMISRGAFDIEGIGPKVIDALMEAALIRNGADLFTLTKDDFLNLDRFAEKSAQNAYDAIRSRRQISLSKFIYALGIDHVGTETAIVLARHFKRIESLAAATYEELEKLPDIGPIVAQSIVAWFRHSYNRRMLDDFMKAGIDIELEKMHRADPRFSGKVFVLTGGLSSLSRDQAADKIRERGGDVSSSVSKNTDYVVAGNDAGSKLAKARTLDVPVLSESDFLKMLG